MTRLHCRGQSRHVQDRGEMGGLIATAGTALRLVRRTRVDYVVSDDTASGWASALRVEPFGVYVCIGYIGRDDVSR